MFIYTVRPGDSVFRIARENNISPESIIRANGLETPDLIIKGQSLILPGVLPQEPWERIVVGGYAYPSIREEVLRDTLPRLELLNVFSATVNADGTLNPMNNDQPVVNQAKAAQVRPRLVITNLRDPEGFSSELAAAVLGDPQIQNQLIQSSLEMMRAKGYAGLDVDFEYVPGEYREAYNCFLAKARAWLHDAGFDLSTAVPAKQRDDQPGLLFEGIDYAAHGKYCDYVILMTYEWGYQSGPPQAVAPVNEVRRTLEYAVSRIPREKILMGIPNYGYDWTLPFAPGSRARVVTNMEALRIALSRGSQIQFDEQAQTPWFRYSAEDGREHVVWFEDARSIAAKLSLVNEFHVGGICYWTVNYPFPQNWWLVRELFARE
ncbi:MAG: glycosyl hydrolase family 18 protein [Oscillospiraceae bacterium]|nr:glycosyl hydrolase family 18 protein [Oscillospiraceae bacterium]